MADLQSTQTEKGSFRCPICLERLTIPRYLPCLHTFCEVCIQTYISSTTTRDKEDNFNVVDCPVCRKRVQEPEKDISSEDWAKSLPLNKWVWTMTANTENDLVKYCLFCKREELSIIAKHWCKSCSEPICDDCKRFHKRVPSLKNHRIVELHNIEQWNEAIDIDENCTIHKGKVFELFCKNHNELCCVVCFANQHKRCANFDSIDEIVMKMNKDQMTEKLKSLSSLHDCITKLQDENKDQIDALCTSKEEICSSIAKRVEEAKMVLDQAHEQWGKYFEIEHAQQTDNIEMVSDELKRFDSTVTEAKAILSSVLKSGSTRQIFVLHWKLHSQINDHFNRMKSLQIWHLTKSYSFKTNLLDNFTDTMKFENVTMSKTPSDALKRIYLSGKSLF